MFFNPQSQINFITIVETLEGCLTLMKLVAVLGKVTGMATAKPTPKRCRIQLLLAAQRPSYTDLEHVQHLSVSDVAALQHHLYIQVPPFGPYNKDL